MLVQVVVADVHGDERLEMLLADSSGAVVCVKHDGKECWNKALSGASSRQEQSNNDFFFFLSAAVESSTSRRTKEGEVRRLGCPYVFCFRVSLSRVRLHAHAR